MIRLNSETYLSFAGYVSHDMLLSGWDAKEYWLFIIYKKKLIN